jgi:hypothetical protein
MATPKTWSLKLDEEHRDATVARRVAGGGGDRARPSRLAPGSPGWGGGGGRARVGQTRFGQDATPEAGQTAATPQGGAAQAAAPDLDVERDFADDIDVLNYALTLEHLENAFYRDGVGLFDFGVDPFGNVITDYLLTIGQHEATHVATLTEVITGLGGSPVAEQTYDFSAAYADPVAFLQTAQALENVGVGAYDGAGAAISDPDLLTAAGTIVAVEALHASYLNVLNSQLPAPQPFETPLSRDEVLEAAAPFLATGAVGGEETADATAEAEPEGGTTTGAATAEATTAGADATADVDETGAAADAVDGAEGAATTAGAATAEAGTSDASGAATDAAATATADLAPEAGPVSTPTT